MRPEAMSTATIMCLRIFLSFVLEVMRKYIKINKTRGNSKQMPIPRVIQTTRL